jgi:hypothetical protein
MWAVLVANRRMHFRVVSIPGDTALVAGRVVSIAREMFLLLAKLSCL